MERIVEYLRASIQDQFLSKTERKLLREMLEEVPLNAQQLNQLRTKVYELATESINSANYRFVVEWIRSVNNQLAEPRSENTSVYFSPGESCLSAIQQQIRAAGAELCICVFTISDDRITDELLLAHKRGLPIRVITDNDKMMDEGSDIKRLAQAGIAVRTDTSPNHMHHKFMIVDQEALITGSYNWTRSAARFNHENILLTRELSVVESFSKQFEELWKIMTVYEKE
jgi:phosphatidylserine/phosphatidylglycerophosphate/cardiolipin synthase-like enzyme